MISVKVITPEGLYRKMDTSILNVVSTLGQRGILPKHVPIVLTLDVSKMSTIENGVRHEFAIAGGMLYFKDDEATILTDAVESQEEIDLDRAHEALKRAEKRLAEQSEKVDVARAEAALSKALNRIQIKG